MSTHVPRFQSFFRFFASFCIGQISHQQHKGIDSAFSCDIKKAGTLEHYCREFGGFYGKSLNNNEKISRKSFWYECLSWFVCSVHLIQVPGISIVNAHFPLDVTYMPAFLNLFNAEATFIKGTRTQKFLKTF